MKTSLRLLVGSWHLLRQIMAFGNPTAGGFTTMDEVLRAVAELNKRLKEKYGIEIAVSGHWWHELLVPAEEPEIGYSAKWNNPRSIGLKDWAKGVKEGIYAPVGRVIPPGFGLPGADQGAFINPDPARRKLAHDMMVYSFLMSEYVKGHEVGYGNVIYWTGPDGIRWKRLVQGEDVLLGHQLNPELEEWQLIVNGVSEAAKVARAGGCTDTILLIEGKPAGDPCYLDVFTDTFLETAGIRQINELIGAPVAQWQGEFCHSRGAGQRFSDALQQAIDGGVFGGRIHLNSGGLGQTDFNGLLSLSGGIPASKLPQYVDNDFLPGEGVEEWIDDQKATIRLLAGWSAQTGLPAEIEFDARFCRYEDTIGELEKSAEWTIGVFEEARAALEEATA